MKHRRPSRHIRRVHTKRGTRRRWINPHIAPNRIIKKGNRFYVSEPEISSQFLGFGKTKKEAIADFNDSLDKIFSNSRERKRFKIKQ